MRRIIQTGRTRSLSVMETDVGHASRRIKLVPEKEVLSLKPPLRFEEVDDQRCDPA